MQQHKVLDLWVVEMLIIIHRSPSRAHLETAWVRLLKEHYLLYCGIYFLVGIFRWRRRKRYLNIAFVNFR